MSIVSIEFHGIGNNTETVVLRYLSGRRSAALQQNQTDLQFRIAVTHGKEDAARPRRAARVPDALRNC